MGRTSLNPYDTRSAILRAASGETEDWVHEYLNAGEWANPVFSESLKKAKRWWRGPLPIPLTDLTPALGVGKEYEYPVRPENLRERAGNIAAGLPDPLDLPPLILEYRAGELSIRDGNHRYWAMVQAGWDFCWALVWYNTEADYGKHRVDLHETIRLSDADDLEDLEWFGLLTEYREIIVDTFRRQERGEVEVLVAEAGGFPIGQVGVNLADKAGWSIGVIWALRVIIPLQNLGIGTKLILAAEDQLTAKSYTLSEISVEKDNPDARRLYERLGYEVVDEVVERWGYTPPGGEPVDVVSEEWVMRKRLRNNHQVG